MTKEKALIMFSQFHALLFLSVSGVIAMERSHGHGIFKLAKENYAIVPSVTPESTMVVSNQLKCFTYCLRTFTKCSLVIETIETLSINKHSCQIYNSIEFGNEHFIEKENTNVYTSFSFPQPPIIEKIEQNGNETTAVAIPTPPGGGKQGKLPTPKQPPVPPN